VLPISNPPLAHIR